MNTIIDVFNVTIKPGQTLFQMIILIEGYTRDGDIKTNSVNCVGGNQVMDYLRTHKLDTAPIYIESDMISWSERLHNRLAMVGIDSIVQ